jgi:hypothetical protein
LRRARRFDFEFLFSLASRAVASRDAASDRRGKIPTRIRFADSAKSRPSRTAERKNVHTAKNFLFAKIRDSESVRDVSTGLA